MTKENLTDILKQLSLSKGVSSAESDTVSLVRKLVTPYVDKIYEETNGSIVAVKYAKNNKNGEKKVERLLLDAHIDEIGMIVTEINKNGFVHFASVGGVDSKILPGAEVEIHPRSGGQALFGVVCALPPHVKKEGDKATNISDMVIDIGFTCEQAKAKISIGDIISFRGKWCELLGERYSCNSFDNRSSVSALIYCMEKLSNIELDIDIYMQASSGEETTQFGAMSGAYGIDPNECIVVDVSFASYPSANKYECGEMGKGVMIGISPLLNETITDKLVGCAKEKEIAYQLEIMKGGTGTNATPILWCRNGVRTGLLSIPLRYMHTPVELLEINDIISVGELLYQYIAGGHNA